MSSPSAHRTPAERLRARYDEINPPVARAKAAEAEREQAMTAEQAMTVDTASLLDKLVERLAPVVVPAIVEGVTGRQPVPRRALSIQEACESLGVSWDFWHEQVEPDVRLVRRGRRKLVPVSEIDAWLDRHAAGLLDGTGSATPTARKTPAKGRVRASRGPAGEPG